MMHKLENGVMRCIVTIAYWALLPAMLGAAPVDFFVSSLESESFYNPEFRVRLIDTFISGHDTGGTYEPDVLRSDEAFECVYRVGTSRVLNAEVSSAARRALGQVNDARAVAALIKIAEEADLGEELRLEAFLGLGKQVTARSAAAAEFLGRASQDSMLSDALRKAAKDALGSVDRLPVEALRALASQKDTDSAVAARKELDRLESLDPRLSIEDARVLERARIERVNLLELSIRDDETHLAESRKPKRGKDAFPVNPFYDPGVIRQRISKTRKRIAREQKENLFDRAVIDLATYCDVIGKTEEFTRLASKSPNLSTDAKKLPVIRYRVTAIKSDGGQVTESVTEIQLLPDRGSGDPEIAELTAKLNHGDAGEEAKKIADALRQLTYEGLTEIKRTYLEKIRRPKMR